MRRKDAGKAMQSQEQERQQQQQTDASSHDAVTRADLLNHMATLNETTSNQLSRVLDARLEPMNARMDEMEKGMEAERADNRSRFRWLVGLVIGVGLGLAALIIALSGLIVAIVNSN